MSDTLESHPIITYALLERTMYEAMRLAATRLPPDVETALRTALDEEEQPLARRHLEVTLENTRLAAEGRGLLCGDTGFPLFFVEAGPEVRIEGGFGALWPAARAAVRRATDESLLRPTMVDPLTRHNPGDNIGAHMPRVDLRFVEGGAGRLDARSLSIVAAPKGGGSEIFGTFYRMLYPADGRSGILKFVLDSIQRGSYAGKICPPAVVGVGIGGTADLCMHLAKRAAVLRPIGSRHPDPDVGEMEGALLEASRSLGIGPLGAGGRNAVLAVHVETAVTHTAALPVAVNAQCCVARRWKAVVHGGGGVEYTGEPGS